MKNAKLGKLGKLALLAAFVAALPAAGAPAAEPVKVIFDTDMYTDFDDAGALACLHALADAGECEILATIACVRDSMAVAMCEIINAYYGRPEIPVGCVKGIGPGNECRDEHARRYGKTVGKFGKWVRHLDSDDAPDAAEVYRRVLSAQPDGSVVVCSVGFLSNLRKLVETDRELVARKVKRWVAMACSYPDGREYNSGSDAESSRIALERWPTPIVFTDFQYGEDCFAGRVLIERGSENNPVMDVFSSNEPFCNGRQGRSAWDETAVLIAVRGWEPYFGAERGTYRMDDGDDGRNRWIPGGPDARDLRVTEKLPKPEVGRIVDELLCREPRLRRRGVFGIAEGGEARAQLFVDGKAAFEAARELQRYVEKMTGAKLAIVREEQRLDPALGTIRFGRPCPGARPDEYVIETDEAGKTLDLTGDAGRGMFYATYRLLECFGVRFWSGRFETVPKLAAMELPADFRRSGAPAFAVRDGQGNSEIYCSGWRLKSGQSQMNPEFGFKDYGVNCGEMLCTHYLQPRRFFSEHPDWYAWRRDKAAKWGYPAPSPSRDAADRTRCTASKKIDALDDQETFFNSGEMEIEDLDGDGGECRCVKCRNQRTIGARASSQPCLSNPAAREQLLKEVLEDLAKSDNHTVGLGSNDTSEFCECEDCRRIVETYGSHSALEGVIANWIACRVRGKYPDVRVGILSYWLKNRPFDERLLLEPEVWVCVTGSYNMSRPAREDRAYADRIECWRRIAPGRLTMWDYYANFRRFTCACPNIDLMADNLRWYRDLGFSRVGDQMIFSNCGHLVDLRSYIHAKFMWNPDQNVELLVDEWFDAVGGPAADLLKRYYREQIVCRDRPGVGSGMYGSGFYEAVTGEELLRWHRYFETAKTLVADDPERFAVIDRMSVGPLVDLFVFRDKVRRAAEKSDFDLPSQIELCRRYQDCAKRYSDQWSEHKGFDIYAYLDAEEAEECRREERSVQDEIMSQSGPGLADD